MLCPSFVHIFPNWDPVMTRVGSLSIHWYGVFFAISIVLIWLWMSHRVKFPPFKGEVSPQHVNLFLPMIPLGGVLGGRIGEIIFYQSSRWIENPLTIFYVWEGGLSSHGGSLGILLFTWYFCAKFRLSFLRFLDLTLCAVPIGCFLGRISNFINGELYGRVTDVPWAMVFPNGGPLPRHPSQLYEAALEGVVLFILCNLCISRPYFQTQAGRLSGLAMLVCGVARCLVETVREPDAHMGYFAEFFTMGQILSLPILLGGAYLLWFRKSTWRDSGPAYTPPSPPSSLST